MNNNSPTITLDDGTQLDSGVVKVMHAIRNIESGGDYNIMGDQGTSKGAYQWNNYIDGKHVPLQPNQIPANFQSAAKLHKLDENDFTPANQNKVAYAQVSNWKNQGLTPLEIDAMWNGAKKDENGRMIHMRPERRTLFQDALAKEMNGTQKTSSPSAFSATPPTLTEDQQADKASADMFNPTFAASTEDSTLARAGKVIGNMPKSAYGFAKGAVDMLNPVNIYNNYKGAIGAIPEILDNSQYTGGIASTLGDLAKETGKSAINIIPEAGKKLATAGYKGATGDSEGAYGDLTDVSRAIENDPVGQILPFLGALKGGAEAIDTRINKTNALKTAKINEANASTMKTYVDNIPEFLQNGWEMPRLKNAPEISSSNFGGMIDKGISAIASPIVSPIKSVFGKAVDVTKNTVGYGARQLTGLDKTSMETVAKNPNVDFTNINRQDLGREIQSSIQKKMADLEDTGKEYKPIRDMADTKVSVTKTDLADMVKEATGLEMKKGRFETSSGAGIRDGKDVRALQNFYDTHQPAFQKGQLTTNEYLNVRADLGKLSKFEREIGKSHDLENISKTIYNKLNSKYRAKVPGLEELDKTFSPMKDDLKEAMRGLVDPEGNLTDSGLTKIARVTENRPNLAAQLEKISPGFMDRVKLLQAAEDLKATAEKHKVGVYGKAIGTGGVIAGIATMNPLLIGASIVEMMITNPANAVKLIQKYGKSKEIINATIEKAKQNPVLAPLMKGATTVKDITKAVSAQKALPATAFSPNRPQNVQ